ncbi:hypothetical protein [Kribbella sp. NPDC006257]|uniref:hypothetical protein n=1 Tax=Kribbella sp. NPDC006257 TaxID=3156738 RepID=UPI0033A023DF
MTDEVQAGTEWVPRFGMLEVSADQAALIRGLFELAAFVADHPEVPLPDVRVNIFPSGDDYAADVEIVNEIAGSLGVTAGITGFGHYRAVRRFGPVEVQSVAITHEAMEAHRAHMSYSDSVRPDAAVGAGESR